MTTSEAANLIGVSRPTMIKLLDEEGIGFRMVGTHRRISRRDVESYWHHQVEIRREQALLFMAETDALELDS
nr:excisionase family DNA-binding protein [Kineosporia mesophila]